MKSTMGEELREASAVILVVASRYVRDMARQIASLIQPDAVVCIAAKGGKSDFWHHEGLRVIEAMYHPENCVADFFGFNIE